MEQRIGHTEKFEFLPYQVFFRIMSGYMIFKADFELSSFGCVADLFFEWSFEKSEMGERFPIFGICLGMEKIVQVSCRFRKTIFKKIV